MRATKSGCILAELWVIFCAILAWVGGWDFNSRGVFEAYGIFVVVTFAVILVFKPE